MSGIRIVIRATYYSPAKGRHYLTARACAQAEASALLAKKYPTEKPGYEDGMCFDPGYHWSSDERLMRVQARLARLYLKKIRRLS